MGARRGDLMDVSPTPLPQTPAGPAPAAPAPTTPASATPPPPQRSPYRRRSLIFLGILVAILILWEGSGFFFAYTDDAYLLSDLVAIAPQVSGPVQSVAIADDQYVARGAVIFTIDPTPYQYELDQAVANEARAQSQIPVDQAALQTAQSLQAAALAQAQQAEADLRRATDLTRSGFESAQDLEDAQTAGRRAADALAAAEDAVTRARQMERLHEIEVAATGAARLLAAWRLAQTRILAPVDGRVTHVTLLPGDMALAGKPLVALIAAHGWYVTAHYKEGVLRHLRPGAPAWVLLDTHPFHLYRARIVGIAAGIDRDPGGSGSGLLPYVAPTVNWIRLQARIPVRFELIDPPPESELFMGSDARTLVIY
jgi:multidrug resistance efflux pump